MEPALADDNTIRRSVEMDAVMRGHKAVPLHLAKEPARRDSSVLTSAAISRRAHAPEERPWVVAVPRLVALRMRYLHGIHHDLCVAIE